MPLLWLYSQRYYGASMSGMRSEDLGVPVVSLFAATWKRFARRLSAGAAACGAFAALSVVLQWPYMKWVDSVSSVRQVPGGLYMRSMGLSVLEIVFLVFAWCMAVVAALCLWLYRRMAYPESAYWRCRCAQCGAALRNLTVARCPSCLKPI